MFFCFLLDDFCFFVFSKFFFFIYLFCCFSFHFWCNKMIFVSREYPFLCTYYIFKSVYFSCFILFLRYVYVFIVFIMYIKTKKVNLYKAIHKGAYVHMKIHRRNKKNNFCISFVFFKDLLLWWLVGSNNKFYENWIHGHQKLFLILKNNMQKFFLL